jgi:hypothetical protein
MEWDTSPLSFMAVYTTSTLFFILGIMFLTEIISQQVEY